MFIVCLEPEDKIALPELLKGGSFTRGKRRFSFKTIQNIQAAKAYVDLPLIISYSVIILVYVYIYTKACYVRCCC